MDFVTAQHRARKKSVWLVLWLVCCLILTVLSVIAVAYIPVSGVLWLDRRMRPDFSFWDGMRFFWVSLIVGGCIAIVTLWKLAQIAERGGELIATQLGGRRVARDTDVPLEKRLLNVTEEMAIAAGMPAPAVFVLDSEVRLNAFAAGLSAGDSVVCVTRGLLRTMSRDELQGVVGHEISHLVNGDSRLNLKLTGILYGIHAVTIIGRRFLSSCAKGSRGSAGAFLFDLFLGSLLCAIGGAGSFFARLVQAAVSREREYLADASSAQFTRHPHGLASALKKLETFGSGIRHPGAIAVSHFFFGAGGRPHPLFGYWFATHPSLSERIARLENRRRPAKAGKTRGRTMPASPGAPALVSHLAGRSEVFSPANIAPAQRLLSHLPDSLRRQARHDAGAIGVVGGLFLSGQDDVRARQEALIPPASLSAAREIRRWLSRQPDQGAPYRLIWLDLVLPVLREMPEAEHGRMLRMAGGLIRADGRVDASEFALYSLMRGAAPSFLARRRAARGAFRPERLEQDVRALLAFTAYAGNADAATAEAAYRAAEAYAPVQALRVFPSRSEISLAGVSQALDQVALASPPYRETVLRACAVAVGHDGAVTPVENELLHAYAQCLDCPAPLLESL